MSFVSDLKITLLKENDRNMIRNLPISKEIDNWLSIYENIEKINNDKKQNNIDLDIQLLLRSIV